MTKNQLKHLEEYIINCELLHIAIEAIEKLRPRQMPTGLAERWIKEMSEEAGFQVSQHDEDMNILIESHDSNN